MRSLKTAVKIWKKEIEFKAITWGISPEHRSHYRKMRQDSFKGLKNHMVSDLLNRHRIGDITLERDHLELLQNPHGIPVFKVIDEIYKIYLYQGDI